MVTVCVLQLSPRGRTVNPDGLDGNDFELWKPSSETSKLYNVSKDNA